MQERIWRTALFVTTGIVLMLSVLVIVDGIRLYRLHEQLEMLALAPAQHAMARVAAVDTSGVRSSNEEDIAAHLEKVHESARNELAAESEQLLAASAKLGVQWDAIWKRWVLTWKVLAVFVALAFIARNRRQRAGAAA